MDIDEWKVAAAAISSTAPLVLAEVVRELGRRPETTEAGVFATVSGLPGLIMRPVALVNGVMGELQSAGMIELISERSIRLVLE